MWCTAGCSGWSSPDRDRPADAAAAHRACPRSRNNERDRPPAGTRELRSRDRSFDGGKRAEPIRLIGSPPQGSQQFQRMKCAVRLERLVEGSPANQLAMQNAQRMAVIDVIPRRKHVHFEPELAGALDALGGDTACAPFDILEHAPMHTFEAEKVVTAVNGRSQHRSLARLRQDIDGFDDK